MWRVAGLVLALALVLSEARSVKKRIKPFFMARGKLSEWMPPPSSPPPPPPPRPPTTPEPTTTTPPLPDEDYSMFEGQFWEDYWINNCQDIYESHGTVDEWCQDYIVSTPAPISPSWEELLQHCMDLYAEGHYYNPECYNVEPTTTTPEPIVETLSPEELFEYCQYLYQYEGGPEADPSVDCSDVPPPTSPPPTTTTPGQWIAYDKSASNPSKKMVAKAENAGESRNLLMDALRLHCKNLKDSKNLSEYKRIGCAEVPTKKNTRKQMNRVDMVARLEHWNFDTTALFDWMCVNWGYCPTRQ